MTSINHLLVELNPRKDKNDKIFYLGKLKFPGNIDCSKGVTFLIFLSDEGAEELQIASLDKDNINFSKYKRCNDRIKVSLENRKDQYGEVFYICKFQFKGIIDCNSGPDGVTFIVFTANPGDEELQIVYPNFNQKQNKQKRFPEVYSKNKNYETF